MEQDKTENRTKIAKDMLFLKMSLGESKILQVSYERNVQKGSNSDG